MLKNKQSSHHLTATATTLAFAFLKLKFGGAVERRLGLLSKGFGFSTVSLLFGGICIGLLAYAFNPNFAESLLQILVIIFNRHPLFLELPNLILQRVENAHLNLQSVLQLLLLADDVSPL